MSRSKKYKAIKNYIHNELGLTKEDIINAIRSDIRQYVEKCMNNTYGDDNNIKRWIEVMVEIKAVKRSRLGCNGCYLSNSELLCKGCNKSERDTNDNIMVVRIDKMDNVYRNDYPLDPGIGVVHSFRINNKIIKAVACQIVIRDGICSKCCFVDTNICSNMRCFSSVREDDKSVIFKKIEL